MKNSKYLVEQIATTLRQVEAGAPIAEITRKLGVSEQTYYAWQMKYSQMGVAEIRRLRMLEEENRKPKQLVADLTLDKIMLQVVLTKSSKACTKTGAWAAIHGEIHRERAPSVQPVSIETVDVVQSRLST